jgi:hypothetical protein
MKKKTKTKKLDHECEHAVKTLTIHYGLGHIMSTRKAPRLLGWWFRRAWQYNLGIPGYLSSLKDFFAVMSHIEMHSAQRCVFPVCFRWIHYCHSSKSTGKETGKTHLCAVHWSTLVLDVHFKLFVILFKCNGYVLFEFPFVRAMTPKIRYCDFSIEAGPQFCVLV